MDPVALLGRARAAGYRVERAGDDLHVRGPREGHAGLIAELREHKPAVIAVLRAEAEAPTRDCYCCTGARWWRLGAASPWVCARCHPSSRPEVEWSAPPGTPPLTWIPLRSPSRG